MNFVNDCSANSVETTVVDKSDDIGNKVEILTQRLDHMVPDPAC